MKRSQLFKKWSQAGILAKVPKLNYVDLTTESDDGQLLNHDDNERKNRINSAFQAIVECNGVVKNLIKERDILLAQNNVSNSSTVQLNAVESKIIDVNERAVEISALKNSENVTSFEWHDEDVMNSCKYRPWRKYKLLFVFECSFSLFWL